MKKIFLFLSLILCVPFFAQNMKAEIENQFRNYNNLIIEKNFEKALQLYGNEDFLKLFSKEQLVEKMNAMFNSPEIDFHFVTPENIVVSDKIIDQKEKKFVKIDFKQKLEMKFNEADLNKDDLLSALQKSFGNEHVKYNDKTGYFLIDTDKTAVANSTDLKNWKFTVLEKKQIPVLIGFIPEQFLKDLK
ncbi:hypothetical protein [Kaistella jeonii]|uniref:DUF4252 domain-containing protein n=1 Tax=Kaistella jeonii TaxID=266749 RepID=A0A0C1F546_9FLAO|nr:hypothetical protein [Kaistella jeonii]KIA88327.1 hypothetical protein OA86_11425 [Kaistella jeonii]SFC23751.1 hypothetical protein SAMN05421876_11060 [Kaistella jeonii]VEI94574.1 Uncharacterised protein [Kaistella jeonii]